MITSPYVFQEIDKGDCNVSPVVCVDDEDEMPWMVIMYHYTGDTFIWADSIVVRADENKYTYDSPAFYHSMRENAKIKLWKSKINGNAGNSCRGFRYCSAQGCTECRGNDFSFQRTRAVGRLNTVRLYSDGSESTGDYRCFERI